VQVDRLTVKLRLRDSYEAIDLGIALLRQHLTPFYASFALGWLLWLAVGAGLLLAGAGLTLALVAMWLGKPLLDRLAVVYLSHAFFGERLQVRATWREFWPTLRSSGVLAALTWRRLSLKRSVLLPVWQLERVSGLKRADRVARLKLIGQRQGETGTAFTVLAAHMEVFMLIGFVMLANFLIPPAVEWLDITTMDADAWTLPVQAIYMGSYALAVALVEPMYVAGGFMLYLNRRVELEGWDLELAFRRMAERLAPLARDSEAGRDTRAVLKATL
jgi:hypothetical protein